VMVPATGIAVAGAKLSVTDAGALPAMRSAEAIANDIDVTACAVAMNPEREASGKEPSEEVRT
jgi:hypothetical protein